MVEVNVLVNELFVSPVPPPLYSNRLFPESAVIVTCSEPTPGVPFGKVKPKVRAFEFPAAMLFVS